MGEFIALIVTVIVGILLIRFFIRYRRGRHERFERRMLRRQQNLHLANLKEDLRQKKLRFERDHEYQSRLQEREDRQMFIGEKQLYLNMSLELEKLRTNRNDRDIENLERLTNTVLTISATQQQQKHEETIRRIEAIREMVHTEAIRLRLLDETQRELQSQKMIDAANEKMLRLYNEVKAGIDDEF